MARNKKEQTPPVSATQHQQPWLPGTCSSEDLSSFSPWRTTGQHSHHWPLQILLVYAPHVFTCADASHLSPSPPTQPASCPCRSPGSTPAANPGLCGCVSSSYQPRSPLPPPLLWVHLGLTHPAVHLHTTKLHLFTILHCCGTPVVPSFSHSSACEQSRPWQLPANPQLAQALASGLDTHHYMSAPDRCHCTDACNWSQQLSVYTPAALAATAACPDPWLLNLGALLRNLTGLQPLWSPCSTGQGPRNCPLWPPVVWDAETSPRRTQSCQGPLHLVSCTARPGVTAHSRVPPPAGERPALLKSVHKSGTGICFFKYGDTCARLLGSGRIRET